VRKSYRRDLPIEETTELLPAVFFPANLKEPSRTIGEVLPHSLVMATINRNMFFLPSKGHGMPIDNFSILRGSGLKGMALKTIEPLLGATPKCQNEFGIVITAVHFFVNERPLPVLEAFKLVGPLEKGPPVILFIMSRQFQVATGMPKIKDAQTLGKGCRPCFVEPNPKYFHDACLCQIYSIELRIPFIFFLYCLYPNASDRASAALRRDW
jgi:hypothetical protein